MSGKREREDAAAAEKDDAKKPNMDFSQLGWWAIPVKDAKRAQAFYTSVFKYQFEEQMPDFLWNFTATGSEEAEKDGHGLLSKGTMFVDKKERELKEVGETFRCYIRVDNMEAARKAITEAGGTLAEDPCAEWFADGKREMPHFSQAFRDTEGNLLLAWTEKEAYKGPARPCSLCWVEIPVKDLKRASDFYTSVFGWSCFPYDKYPEGEYMVFNTTGAKTPDRINMSGLVRVAENATIPEKMSMSISIYVSNLEAAMEKIKANGGVLRNDKPYSMPIGRMMHFVDSEGNEITLTEPKQM